jgi:hypothetical protein
MNWFKRNVEASEVQFLQLEHTEQSIGAEEQISSIRESRNPKPVSAERTKVAVP